MTSRPPADGLRLTVLGCSGTYAGPGNPCSGYVLQSAHTTVLLDCGPGTLGPLQEVVALADLDAIVITHAHPDHWLEIPVLRNVFAYFEPRGDVPVYGTQQTSDLDAAVSIKPSRVEDPLVWTVINEESQLVIGDQHWRFSRTDHSVETLAVRVDIGKTSFGFTADTGPAWDYGALGPGLNTLLSEASLLRSEEGSGSPHVSAHHAGTSARRSGVARLILTHLPPGSDVEAHRLEAETAYGGPVEMAAAGSVFDI